MIGNILNQGSNSTIYLAMQKLSCKLVAIKTVNLENKPKSIINKISEEVSILFKLKHSSILRPYLTFKDRTYYYIVMEFCAGGTLMNFVKAR
jgi:serine/threonine protein kinase